jgi:tetratricopeptide (TPR) repeat protein
MRLTLQSHSHVRTVLVVIILAAAVAASYCNTLHNPFVLDDRFVVTDNASIRNLRDLGRVLSPPQTGAPVQGRPVANFTFAVNYAIGGRREAGYHLVNVAIHLGNCLLLFALTRRTLDVSGLDPRLTNRASAIALAAALLWGVHPLASAAVGYVSQRTEQLAAFFYLLTLYFVLRGTTMASRQRWVFDAAAILFCALGMASKEVMVTAPLVALLFERTFVRAPWRDWLRRRALTYAGLFAAWILLAALVIHSGTRSGTAGFGAGVSPWRYLLTQCDAVLIYLKLQFWPQPLIFDYGPGLVAGVRQVWPQAIAVLILLVAAVVLLWRFPRAGFLAVAWFLVLAPSSSVIPIRTQSIGEHRAYLPLAVMLVGVSVAAARWIPQRAMPLMGAVLVILAVAFGFLTFRRNADYATPLGLWRDTLAKRPDNPRTYLNIAVLDFVPRGQYAAAIDYFTKALRLSPDFTPALVNRASISLLTGDSRGALADANELVRLIPREAQAYLSRAAAYEALGEYDREIQDATTALSLDPNNADAYYDRGNAYLAQGLYPLALDDYSQAIRLGPRERHFYFNRANVEHRLERYVDALRDFDQAIQLDPGWADAYVNRGITRVALRQYEMAIADFTKAAELKPAWSEPYLDRAVSYATLGQYEKAWQDVREVRQRGGTPDPEFIRKLTAASGHGE